MKHNHKMLLGVALSGITFTFAPIADASETGAPEPVNYARPFEPPTRSAFIPLRPSTIDPAGWPRDCYLAARDGFTGHMHVIEKQFPLP